MVPVRVFHSSMASHLPNAFPFLSLAGGMINASASFEDRDAYKQFQSPLMGYLYSSVKESRTTTPEVSIASR